MKLQNINHVDCNNNKSVTKNINISIYQTSKHILTIINHMGGGDSQLNNEKINNIYSR